MSTCVDMCVSNLCFCDDDVLGAETLPTSRNEGLSESS